MPYVPPGMTKRLQRNKDLRITNLSPATAAKVAVQSLRNFVLAGEQALNQALQLFAAFRGSRKWVLRGSRSLAGKSLF
jgi:hypothetical protein